MGYLHGFKAASRRFDIEFRTQFVYSYDAATEKYIEHKISVPMIFVQEEVYDDFASDVKSANKITISVDIDESDVEHILEDYDELIPVFIENKDMVTEETIIAYIGDKITF